MFRITTKSCRDAGCPNCLLLNICLHEEAGQVGIQLFQPLHRSHSSDLRIANFFRVAPVGEAFRQVRDTQGDEVFFSLYNTGGVSDHHPRLAQIHVGENPPDVTFFLSPKGFQGLLVFNHYSMSSTFTKVEIRENFAAQPCWFLPLWSPPFPRSLPRQLCTWHHRDLGT